MKNQRLTTIVPGTDRLLPDMNIKPQADENPG